MTKRLNFADDNDLHRVKFAHEAVHERLVNWARWCSSGGGTSAASPMFRLYRAPRNRNAFDELRIPVDGLDGMRLEKVIALLPETHRDVIRWFYVYSYRGIGMGKACRGLAIAPSSMAQLLHDSRSMVKNRLDRNSACGTIAPQFESA
jgi:hypothetical protein